MEYNRNHQELINEVIKNVWKHTKEPRTYTICGTVRKYGPLRTEELTQKGDIVLIKKEKRTEEEIKELKVLKANSFYEDKVYLSTYSEDSIQRVKLIVHVKNTQGLKDFKTTHSFKCYKDDTSNIILDLTEKGYTITKTFLR